MNTNEIAIPGPDGEVANNDAAVAWEEIAPGRYMPRRVRGSHGASSYTRKKSAGVPSLCAIVAGLR